MRRRTNIMKAKLFRYNGLLWVLCTFLMIAAMLFVERSGIRHTAAEIDHAYIEAENSLRADQVHKALDKTCLLLTNSQEANSQAAAKELEHILLDMKVGYALVDVSEDDPYDFTDYETVVVALSNISPLETKVLELADWVKRGGSAMFPVTLEQETYSRLIEPKLGIISSGYKNVVVESCYPDEAFMIGGGRAYPITDPFESARAVELSEKAKVYVWSGDEKQVPLIWEHSYGDGKFVVVNIGIYEKSVRGFYAAAYSLLTDCIAYPVINGAVFYLDDFPAPVSGGNDIYIKRNYGLSIDNFYSSVWWPDMLNLASEHQIKYTGVLIENYDNDTSGEITRTNDTHKFQYFGNMLLHQQGEIGYHGYNHQPLCLDNVDYQNFLPYETWTDKDAMEHSMRELISFADKLFPNIQKSVYVPPSNILSAEGRKMLSDHFPEIRTIASHYLSSDFVYQQEFEVAEDGIVEQPRITSSCVIDDYMMLTAMSELNMHYVNSHFMHPDDLLDESRGAEKGWATLKTNLENYMNWLYTSAPQIDPLTGSELSGRIQRFAAVTAEKIVTEDAIQFKIHNLYDRAYFMVRFNKGSPGDVIGGSLEHLTGNLYLLQADSDNITIRMSR